MAIATPATPIPQTAPVPSIPAMPTAATPQVATPTPQVATPTPQVATPTPQVATPTPQAQITTAPTPQVPTTPATLPANFNFGNQAPATLPANFNFGNKSSNELGNFVGNAVTNYGKGLAKTYAGAIGFNPTTGKWGMPDFLKQAESSTNPNPVVAFGENALASGASLVNLLFAPITQAVSATSEAASSDPMVQKLATGALSSLADAGDALKQLETTHPEATKNINNALAFLLTAGSAGGLDKPVTDLFKAGSDVSGTTSQIPSDTSVPTENGGVNATPSIDTNTEPSPRDIIGNQFRKTVEQYTKPSNELTKAESMGSNPIGVLQSYGNSIIPTLEDGKITARGIEEPKAIIEDAIQKLGQIKSDSVFQSDQTVPFNEFKQMALDYASLKGSVSEHAPLQKDINEIFKNMESDYTDSPRLKNGELPLSEVDQIKTHQAELSRNFKPNVKTFNPDAHYIVSKAARKLVESLSDDPNVHEFNKLLESHYDALKLLDSLKDKAPHGGKFTRAVDTIGGTVVGGVAGMAAGHPWLGAIIGRSGARLIDSIFHNNFIPNPLKRMLIKDLGREGTPAVVSAMQKFIDENLPDIKDLGEKIPQSSQPKSRPMSNASNTAGIKTKKGIK